MVLSGAINAVATPIRSPMADANESDAIRADAGGLSTLANDVSAESDATVALALNKLPARVEYGDWEYAVKPNIIRQLVPPSQLPYVPDVLPQILREPP